VNPQNISLISFALISAILLLFAMIVLWKIYKNEINLEGLLTEPAKPADPPGTPPKASLARFQFLVFSFVVAGLFLLLSIEAGTFVEIPNNVLGLLGISGGSYLVSKAMK
jgi:sterol desaturase/sphingolipid hydroxylase (fatty acid hydroxylase superfamily)